MVRALLFAFVLGGLPAAALDKQGKAGGTDDDDGFDVSGALVAAISPYNPGYAARPDNTGLAFLRYAFHADVDLIGRRLSIPIDINTFTDRKRPGAAKVLPTELDLIAGVTTTWPAGPGALEAGVRVEHDRPVDRAGFTQTYVDVRARWMLSLAPIVRGLGDALRGGDVSGYATLGWFAVNPTYAARPDNTGLALLRYGLHAEVSALDGLIALGLDGTMFTDRLERAFVPSELDVTPELVVRRGSWEFHAAYERDLPLDRGEFTQSFVYLLVSRAFDLVADEPVEKPLRHPKANPS